MNRVANIDIVRGIVMIIMVSDHVRDFFGNHDIAALDLSQSNTALFFSRWITHLCAPTFVFLSGASIFLQNQKKSVGDLARFLISRGLVLIVFEQTVLRCFGWYFNFDYRFMNANVLWGIGGAMILMAGLIYIPRWAVLLIGIIIITSINWLLQAATAGQGLWKMFFAGGNIEYLPGHNFYVSYPFIPWLGIMALGYGLASYLLGETKSKWKWHHCALISLSVFIVVRLFFSYGDPMPWQHQKNNWFTFLSFINLEKYPPSFLFALVTLSFTFLFLAVAEQLPMLIQLPLQLVGRVPLFFYAMHIVLVHAAAVMVAWIRFGHAEWLYTGPQIFWDKTLPGHPIGYGLSLPLVYMITAVIIAFLYPLSRWYERIKSSREISWLKYF